MLKRWRHHLIDFSDLWQNPEPLEGQSELTSLLPFPALQRRSDGRGEDAASSQAEQLPDLHINLPPAHLPFVEKSDWKISNDDP